MKTIVLLGLNARHTHSNPALYYLREYCRGLPWRFFILEYGTTTHLTSILARVAELRPDALGLSVYTWNASLVRLLVPEVKKVLPGCAVILGGPEVSYTAEEWLRSCGGIDRIICGPGEEALRALLGAGLDAGGPVIRGKNPPFHEIPFPYRAEDLAALEGRYLYYEASRGCAYRCMYCLSSRDDQPCERKPLETVRQELSCLLDARPAAVKFVDRTFNADRTFAREIWRFLIESGSASRFHFEVHPVLLEDEDFSVLGRAPGGLFQFEVGVQSTNADTLREIRRPGEWSKIGEKIRRLLELGTARVHLDLIAGLPHEGMESFERSFNEVYALGPSYLQLGFLKVLPGTELAERKEEYGLVHTGSPPYRVLSNRWLSFEDLTRLDRIEGLLNSLYNSGRFAATLPALERVFPSPFRLYDGLSNWWHGRDMDHRRKEWRYCAEGIIDFISRSRPETREEVLERLKDDWKAAFGSQRLPHALRGGA